MTWLGRLLNSVIEKGLRKRGFNVTQGSFHVSLQLQDEGSLIPLLREVVEDAIRDNPLATPGTERMVDLGPHHKHLSPDLQGKSCEDWLDCDFLRAWAEGLSELRPVAADSELAAKLMALT
jgi:hypothetical protein